MFENETDLRDYNKKRAEKRYALIKDYERFSAQEYKRLGDEFKQTKVIRSFCENNCINWITFYSYLKGYRKGGIEALLPKFGWKKGKSSYKDYVIPILKNVIEPGMSFAEIYRKVQFVCEEAKKEPPSYDTVIRLVRDCGLVNLKCPPKQITLKTKSKKPIATEYEFTKKYMPEWFRVVDREKLNIAFYKFSLILPLLNPDLEKQEKYRMIEEIVNKTHHPLPEIKFKIPKQTLYQYIDQVKKDGFEALIPKQTYKKAFKRGDHIDARIDIDIKDPLKCLSQLRSFIDKYVTKYPDQQRQALEILDSMAGINCPIKTAKYKPLFLEKPLTTDAIVTLKKFKHSQKSTEKLKSTAILMVNQNHSVIEIMHAVSRSYPTIREWINRFNREGFDFIQCNNDTAKNNPELAQRMNRIVKILHHSPKDYCINRASWGLKEIGEVYEKEYGKHLPASTVGKALKKLNYSWRRARKVLTNNDPGYREKTQLVLDTLRGLQENELFFFIDEAGPWRVLKYGGKSYMPKGETKKYPEFQKSKGRVTFISSLEARSNQVHCAFTVAKDSLAVIHIIKFLFYKFHSHSKIYITWDSASWHKSRILNDILYDLNSRISGPKVVIVPLPKKAQYLNVIEAVFSGMKRAVVHNSDYRSVYEMKTAISRHFRDRNSYFKENPKRAGNKIWDKEKYDFANFESGLHKHV